MVNNAGICTEAANPAPVDESSEEAFDRHLQINTKGAYLGCKYAVEQMKKQEPHACGVRGCIVNVASLGATVGIPGLGRINLERSGDATVANIGTVCYNASKGAIVSLTKTVAVDVGQFGITCNAICPGCKYPLPANQNLRTPQSPGEKNSRLLRKELTEMHSLLQHNVGRSPQRRLQHHRP